MILKETIIVAGPLALLSLALLPRRAQATANATGASSSSSSGASTPASSSTWRLPAAADPYRVTIAAAEVRNGIPAGLLGRLLYQESRFRADIIDGRVTSSAGAVGIAQIVPRWHPDVNPLDPYAAIDYAAGYLAKLERRFGSWRLALAAYNWGPTALASSLQESGGTYPTPDWPAETRAYVHDIATDIGGLA